MFEFLNIPGIDLSQKNMFFFILQTRWRFILCFAQIRSSVV